MTRIQNKASTSLINCLIIKLPLGSAMLQYLLQNPFVHQMATTCKIPRD